VLAVEDAAAIAERFGLGDGAALGPRPAARGELGQVWRLTTTTGAWAVKEPFEPQVEDQAELMAAYHEAVVAAGVPAPAIVRTTDGAILADVGTQVRVYPWVEMHGTDTGIDAARVGELVAAIHQVRMSTDEAVDPWYAEPVGAARWDQLVARLTAHGAPHAAALGELRDELVALERLVSPPSMLQVCHRDLWADNLRATPAGDLCVIDWENCGAADPSQEVALVLFEFARGDAGRARALYAAYVGAGGPGRVDGPCSFSMTIAQLHHIGARACELWPVVGSADDDRRRALDRIEEFVGEPLTHAVIDGLLAALGSR